MTAIHLTPAPIRRSADMLLPSRRMQGERPLDGALPHRWGVHTLVLDQTALIGGSASLTALECVLPDGTPVHYPGRGAQSGLSIEVGTLCQAGGVPVRVYLTLPPVTRDRDAQGGDEHDEYDGDAGRAAVERMRLRCMLLAVAVDQPLPPDQCLCPLFDVARDADGTLRLDDYHPPLLRLEGAAFLGTRGLPMVAGALTLKLWRKVEELANAVDAAAAADETPSGAVHTELHAARTLAAGLPLLDLCVNEPSLHPHELYRLLAGLVGQLTALGGTPLPLKLQPYRHDDCMPQFLAVCRHVEQRLDALQAGYERHRFTQVRDGFSRRLFEEMHDDVIIELRPQAGQTLADMARWLHGTHIAGTEMLATVQAQRQGGATVRQLSAADARQLRLPADAALFVLKNARIPGKQSDAYQAGAPLMIHGSRGEHMPAQIFLYRRKRIDADAQAPRHPPSDSPDFAPR